MKSCVVLIITEAVPDKTIIRERGPIVAKREKPPGAAGHGGPEKQYSIRPDCVKASLS